MPLIMTKADADSIQKLVVDLLQKTKARCVVLVDQSGRCVAHADSSEKFDVDALAALIAGSFSSTRALAGLVGETEFFSLFHQGENKRIQNIVVDNDRLLSVVFDQRATVGRVRLCAETTAERLAERFRQIAQRKTTDECLPRESLVEDTGKRLDQIFEP